jgi:hypothetical protein
MLPAVRQGVDRRALRELVRLLARRASATGLGRLARFGAVGLAAACVAWVVMLRVDDGAAPTVAVPVKAVRLALWLAAIPAALAASHERMLADRREGFEIVMFAKGFSGGEQRFARFAAAFGLTAVSLAVPACAAGLASLACAPSLVSAGDRLLVLLVVLAFALIAGGVLGPLAAACELVAPRRGRALFIGVLAVSWALADLASSSALSITGALGLLLRGLLSIAGLGGVG